MKNRNLLFVVVGLLVALTLAACCLAGGGGALWAYNRGLFEASGESTPASEAEVGPTSEALTEPAPAPAHPEQIAFLSSRDNPEFVSDIYLMNIDGSGLSEITDSSGLIQGLPGLPMANAWHSSPTATAASRSTLSTWTVRVCSS